MAEWLEMKKARRNRYGGPRMGERCLSLPYCNTPQTAKRFTHALAH